MTAYDKALSLLAVREHNRRELSEKLVNKGFKAMETEEALDRLENEGYLSERRYCQSFLRSRLRRNPEGKELLIMRLCQKGVDRKTAREETELYFEEHEDEIASIYSEYSERLIRTKGDEKANLTLMRKGIKIRDID